MANDPYRAYNFNLLIEGITVAGFVEASGLGADISVIAYREGGAGQRVRHLPGQVNYVPLVLRYGVSQDHELYDWFNEVSAGAVTRRNVSVLQYEPDGRSEAFRWNLFDAWPSQFRTGALNASENAIAIEEIVLVYDRMERD